MATVTTPEQRQLFAETGYLLVPAMFSQAEVDSVMADFDRLRTTELVGEAGGRNKSGMIVEDGRAARLQFEVHKTETKFALASRHPRLAGLMQELMGMPLYIYHSKLAFKAAFVGSVQYWHQDYGYWQVSHPRPDMASIMVMLDEHTEDNACLQVLAGSHLEGVVPHELQRRESTGDGQQRIPAELMHKYCAKYPRVPCVGKPGTIIAWHSNLMHASSHNVSENDRKGLIVAFNAVGNSPEGATDSNVFTTHSQKPVELTEDNCLLR